MKPLIRWVKFNVVGAMGVVVQLVTLAALNRWVPGHYLWASAAAIEVTLIHNFLWHTRFTWRDRQEEGSPMRRFWRFQVSNGTVSLVGNLVLMRLLVQGGHLPVVVANGVAILGCSLANFCLGDRWAFRGKEVLAAG